jgi:iron(III) transport system ATP-binding protein
MVHTAAGTLELLEPWSAAGAQGTNPEVLVLPESLEFLPDPDGEARVLGREFLGQDWAYWVQWGEERLRLRLPLAQCHARGDRGVVRLRARGGGWLFPGGQRLRACPATTPR